MNNDVKIFMCTHKPFSYVPPLCVAVCGGSKLNPPPDGAIPDYGDRGSISEKNPEYCELTVQYYAWKNEKLDSYGFCHYRRFLSFYEAEKRPYLVFGKLSSKQKKRLIPTADDILEKTGKYDIIIPKAEDMGMNVYQKYVDSEHLFGEDIDLFIKILKDKYPYLAAASDEYMMQNKQYFCNMFVMKREIFYDYSERLFSLLFEFDKHKKMHGDFQKDRTDGYLAERFLGVYLTYARSQGKTVYECLRIDTDCSLSKRMLYKLFPPESKRRFFAKRLLALKNKPKTN